MSLSEIEARTLIILAEYGPLAGYDLHSKKRGDRSGEYADTVIMSDVHWLAVRKKLLKLKLIKELKKEGRRQPYKLREDGFDLILRSQLAEINDFDNFASNYTEYFPMVFGLWGELKKHELDEYVKKSLAGIIDRIYADVFRELKLKVRERYSHDEFIKDISTRVYVPDLYIDDEDEFCVQILSKLNFFSDSVSIVKEFIEGRISEEESKLNQKLDRIKQVKKNHLLLK